MQELIKEIKQLYPYTKCQCEEKYMETVMDYIYSEIRDELLKL